MKFMFGLQHPLTCNPWTTLLNPCNKVRGEYICKEVFLCLPSCVFIMRPSFLRPFFMRLLLLLSRYDMANEYTTLEPHHQIVLHHIQDTNWGRVLPLSRDAVGVFYSSSQLGKAWSGEISVLDMFNISYIINITYINYDQY